MILESKLRGERLTFIFHFSDEMEPLETIESHDFVVSVLSGTDADPMDLLYGAGEHEDGLQQVSQQFHAGIPGVIYLLTCEVVTSEARTLRRAAKLAILPSQLMRPPVFGTLYTTKLYPLEVLEEYAVTFTFGENRLREMPFPLDEMQVTMAAVSGVFSGGLKTYSHRDEFKVTLTPQTSTLLVKLIQYSTPPDEMQVTMSPQSGVIDAVLIQYVARPEEMYVVMSPLSGTLT